MKARATPELWENTFFINPKTKGGEKKDLLPANFTTYSIFTKDLRFRQKTWKAV